MLNDSKVTANIPAGDLARARDFYADKLGLTPAEEPVPGEVLRARGQQEEGQHGRSLGGTARRPSLPHSDDRPDGPADPVVPGVPG